MQLHLLRCLGARTQRAANRLVRPRQDGRAQLAARGSAEGAGDGREAAVRLDRGRFLVAGGLDASLQSASGVFSLDPRSGRVRRLGQAAQAFHDAASAVIGGGLFIFGGGSATSIDTVQNFDLARHTTAVVGRLPQPLSDLTAVSSGGTVYLIGGYDGKTARAEVYSTTDGVSYRTLALLPLGLRYAAVAFAAGRIVIAGGVTDVGVVSTVLVLDPRTGRVSMLGHLPAPLGHASALALGGEVYIFGGRSTSGTATSDITRVDPVSGSIAPVGRLPQPIADAAAVETGPHSGMLIGGWRNHAVAQVVTVRTH